MNPTSLRELPNPPKTAGHFKMGMCSETLHSIHKKRIIPLQGPIEGEFLFSVYRISYFFLWGP